VAGGARGIGRAIAEAFAADGAAVALFDLDPAVADTARDIGERQRVPAHPYHVDVIDFAAVQQVTAVQRFEVGPSCPSMRARSAACRRQSWPKRAPSSASRSICPTTPSAPSRASRTPRSLAAQDAASRLGLYHDLLDAIDRYLGLAKAHLQHLLTAAGVRPASV
jgi:hypothetical protein